MFWHAKRAIDHAHLSLQVSPGATSYGRNSKTSSGAWPRTNAFWRLLRNTANRPGRSNSPCSTMDPACGMKWAEQKLADTNLARPWERRRQRLECGEAAAHWVCIARACRCLAQGKKPSHRKRTWRSPKESLWRSWKRPGNGWRIWGKARSTAPPVTRAVRESIRGTTPPSICLSLLAKIAWVEEVGSKSEVRKVSSQTWIIQHPAALEVRRGGKKANAARRAKRQKLMMTFAVQA